MERNAALGSVMPVEGRHLYFFNWQLQGVLFGIVLDDIRKACDAGADVLVLSCDGELKPCWSNRTARQSTCTECRFHKRNAFANLRAPITHLKIADFVNLDRVDGIYREQRYRYQSTAEIKRLMYKGVRIGYGALSSYVSWTRNHEPVIDGTFRTFFDRLLKQQVMLKEAIDTVIDAHHPDVVSVFNGRTADVRPVFETAMQRNIPTRVIEGILAEPGEFRRVVISNALPHSIEMRTKQIEDLWTSSSLPEEEKEGIAASFFEGRRSGRPTRDVKSYVAGQEHGLLPEGWDPSKRNVVIFLSSEDEFAAIGDEFDRHKMFATQEEGVKEILKNVTEPHIQFYLRIHPNLMAVGYGYHRRLYELARQFANLVVIAADSPVSSYGLIDHADKIVVFGSTVGVEACFWGKPTVLLGGAYYYHLDVAYTPRTQDELFGLLRRDLPPRPRGGALKYGYYVMNFPEYSDAICYDPKVLRFCGAKIGLALTHVRLLGSPLLFKVFALLRFRMLRGLRDLLSPEEQHRVPVAGA